MASGASGLVNLTSAKPFHFQSDEVLCSYDDEFSQESGNGVISDPPTGKDFNKDFQKSRMSRYSHGALINLSDESAYQEMCSTVERCMKRHTDDVMRVLEGISSRLAHLELYCYNVDKSVGEIRLNLGRDYDETDARLTSVEKHLGEVSRSVKILSDKQELAEAQKKLAKLQFVQKELSSPNTPQYNVEQSTSPTSDHYKTDDTSELQNQHLAIVLHHQHQVPSQQQSSPTRRVEVPLPVQPSSQVAYQNMTQGQHYYVTSAPYQVQVHASQGQYLTSDTQYQTPQPLQQDINLVRLQPVPAQVSQAPHQVHQFVQYQQQPQQSQQMMSAPLSVRQAHAPVQSRPQSASGYPPHQPSQQLHQAPREAVHQNIHKNNSFSCMTQQVVTSSEAMPNGYGAMPVQQQPPPQQIKSNYGFPNENIYMSMGPHQSFSPATAYMMCGNQEVRRQSLSQSQFPQGSSTPAIAPLQHPQQTGEQRMTGNSSQSQFIRNIPYNDPTDKLVSMGFRADHVAHVIQRTKESGQAVDFNNVFSKLNVQTSGPHGGWTG